MCQSVKSRISVGSVLVGVGTIGVASVVSEFFLEYGASIEAILEYIPMIIAIGVLTAIIGAVSLIVWDVIPSFSITKYYQTRHIQNITLAKRREDVIAKIKEAKRPIVLDYKPRVRLITLRPSERVYERV